MKSILSLPNLHMSRIAVCMLIGATLAGCNGLPVSDTAAGSPNDGDRQASVLRATDRAALRAAERSGHLGLAIRLATQQLNEHPSHWETRVTLARLWSRAGRHDEAAQTLAPLGDDRHPAVLLERARLALDRRQALPARRWLEEALGKTPQLPEANNLLGIALDMLGEPAAAQARYRMALETAGEDDKVRYNLGRSLLASGHAAEAIQILQPLSQRSPQPAVYAAMATALLRNGDIEGARALLQDWLPPAAIAQWLAQEKRP